jgi:hypothetical protein
MPSPWVAVDDLMRELGSVRHAALSLHPAGVAKAAIENAIRQAADAIDSTIDRPTNVEKLMVARDAVGVAGEVIRLLDAEIGRSLRIRANAEALRARAAQLIRETSA